MKNNYIPDPKMMDDDMIDNIHKSNFIKFLQKWINEKINSDLQRINTRNIEFTRSSS